MDIDAIHPDAGRGEGDVERGGDGAVRGRQPEVQAGVHAPGAHEDLQDLRPYRGKLPFQSALNEKKN